MYKNCYHTSTGPLGTEMWPVCAVEFSCMNEAIIGCGWKRGLNSPLSSRNAGASDGNGREFQKTRRGWNMHDVVVKFVGRAKSFRIPGRDFAEHAAAMFLAENFDHQVQMPAHHTHLFLEVRLRAASSPVSRKCSVCWKIHGIVKGAATDAHAGTAGFVQHHFRRCGVVTSPLPMTGMRFTACDDVANAGQIDRAAEALFARAAMNEDGGDAGVFQRASQIGRGDILIIPTQAHLGRDGNFDRVHHAFGRAAAVFSNSVIMAEPPPTWQTLRTGQPMLMSTEAMPSDSR